MNWKTLKLLLSKTLLVAAFGYHNEVNAELVKGVTRKSMERLFSTKLCRHCIPARCQGMAIQNLKLQL